MGVVKGMSPERMEELRVETVDMFYHGFNNYMDVAFPEDEVLPLPPSLCLMKWEMDANQSWM